MHTRGSAPWKIALSLALYMAQEDAGEPGKGSMFRGIYRVAESG